MVSTMMAVIIGFCMAIFFVVYLGNILRKNGTMSISFKFGKRKNVSGLRVFNKFNK